MRRARADIVIPVAWGLAEASVFFVVPDAAVGWFAMRRPGRAAVPWAAATLGGVAGATVLYGAVRAGWDSDDLFGSLPGVRAGDLERVRTGIQRDPTHAFVSAAVLGLPVKFHVAEAARERLGLRRTLTLVVANRAPRIGLFTLALASVGVTTRRPRQQNPRLTAVLYGLGWAVFYGWYWLGRSAGGRGARSIGTGNASLS